MEKQSAFIITICFSAWKQMDESMAFIEPGGFFILKLNTFYSYILYYNFNSVIWYKDNYIYTGLYS